VALEPEDPRPSGISVDDAYAVVRSWYQGNVEPLSNEGIAHYAAAAKPYVESLPPPGAATAEEMKDCLREVISNDLEWGYQCSDGRYKMASYAFAAFETAGEDPFQR
jgi:hypothetical protein